MIFVRSWSVRSAGWQHPTGATGASNRCDSISRWTWLYQEIWLVDVARRNVPRTHLCSFYCTLASNIVNTTGRLFVTQAQHSWENQVVGSLHRFIKCDQCVRVYHSLLQYVQLCLFVPDDPRLHTSRQLPVASTVE